MIKTKVKSEMRTIDAATAKKMLTRNSNNRVIRDSHVGFLAKQMSDGTWMFDGSPIRFNRSRKLLDGQHRLSAIIKSDTVQEMLVLTGINDEAFKVMDTGKNRNASDVFSIERIPNPYEVAAATRIVFGIKNGQYSPAHMNSFSRPSNTELLDYFYNNKRISKCVSESHKWYIDINRLLTKSAIAGYFFLMREKNVTEAEEFWSKLCTGAAIKKGSPILVLQKKLVAEKMSKYKISSREKTALIFKAWNSCRRNETIKTLSLQPKEKFPELI